MASPTLAHTVQSPSASGLLDRILEPLGGARLDVQNTFSEDLSGRFANGPLMHLTGRGYLPFKGALKSHRSAV